MKNNLFYSILVILSAGIFSGCSDDEKAETIITPAVIQGTVYTFDVDESGVQWENNQMIGVSMLKANSTEIIMPYHNIKHKATVYPVGYFSPVSTDEVLYYPEDGSKVDIVAYYPYKDNLKDDLYPLNIADQTVADNFSFVYANNSKGLNRDNKKTMMELRPVVAELNVELEAGDGVKDEYLANATIKLTGLPTKANFNLLTGSIQNITNVQDILLPAYEESQGNGASGRILPSTDTDGYYVEIVLPGMGGRTEKISLASWLSEIKSGIRYIGVVKVSLDKIEFVSMDEEPIKDWEEDDNVIQGNGNSFLVRPISGLLLGDLKASAGNNPFAANSGIPMDSWFKTVNATSVWWNSTIQLDEQLNHNVLYLSHTGGTAGWYQSFVGYRMSKAELGEYILKFRVKGTGKINCFVRTSTSKCPLLTVLVGGKYPTYREVTATSEYVEYSVTYNFARMATSGRASYADADATDASVADYDDFYIGFYPTATNSNFYLDHVSLTKVKEN